METGRERQVIKSAAVRFHALLTLLLGALYLLYHPLWIGKPEPPFPTPGWLVAAQLAWGLISFGMIFLYQSEGRSPVLPALYVTFTGATYSYVWYLGASRGTVEDDMVPDWWKIAAGIIGLVLLLEAARQLRLRETVEE